MIKIILCGALGRMGRALAAEIDCEEDLELSGAVEAPGRSGSILGIDVTSSLQEALPRGDVVVDFTNPDAALSHIKEGSAAGKPVVVGTTGLSPGQLAEARKASSKVPLLISPNMSAGVNLMFKVVEDVGRTLSDFDAEIIEIHHNKKKDAPSGTAARLAEALERVRKDSRRVHGRSGILGPRGADELGLHSIRGGDVVGEHTVIFAGEGERFEITHRAHSRRTFARGTVRAIRFIAERPSGLYSMADVLGLETDGGGP
jgi:4-hydroxy-tetrahydrodipicolinate reductase